MRFFFLPAVLLLGVVGVVGVVGLGACGDREGVPAPSSSSKTASTVDGGTASSGSTGDDASSTASETNSGEATYYNAEGKGACGIQTPADYLVCAINDEQYSKENCGRCVEVTGPGGKRVVVRIIDKCPGCDRGDLDLSETAFTRIAAKNAGRIKITWRFVDCP